MKLFSKTHIINFDSRQDYVKLKQKHNKNNLFVDHSFPALNKSVFVKESFKKSLKVQNRLSKSDDIIWKRAKEISSDAELFSNMKGSNYKCSHLSQGSVGNC